MLKRTTLRRLRPWLLLAAGTTFLWAWAIHARTNSIHVSDLRGTYEDDRYTVTCRINNPTPGDVQLTAAVSVVEISEDHDGTQTLPLAHAHRELLIPATSQRHLEVDFDPTRLQWRAVRPEVVLKYAAVNP